jgi:NOL1/NOP2/sun family putative RNA methylase
MKFRHLPDSFADRLVELIPEDKRGEVEAGLKTVRPTTFRRNMLRCPDSDMTVRFAADGITAEPVSWYPDAYVLRSPGFRAFQETQLYRTGGIYVQSLSSMLPPLVLDPQPGERVLDLCAAPGSKTTQMAALMANRGEIVANDASPIRSLKLKHNLDLQGVTVARTTVKHGETVWMDAPESFDRVLVDVPCSMEGTFCDEDPKSYRDWTPNKPKVLGKRQQWLLRSGISACRVGGTIVYSTCTLAPEENEAVVDWILRKEHGNVMLADIVLDGVPWSQAVAGWKTKSFMPEIIRARRVLPSPGMEGFFVAKLVKMGRTVPTGI